MDIQKTFKQALKVVMLDEAVMKKVAKDKNALKPALLIIGLFAVISALGLMLFPPTIIFDIAYYRPDILTTILRAATTFLIFGASFYTAGYLGEKLFNSKLDGLEYVKVLGFGQLVGIVSLVPSLAALGWIWSTVIFVFVSRKLADLDWGSLLLLTLLTVIAASLLQVILQTLGLPVLDYAYGGAFSVNF